MFAIRPRIFALALLALPVVGCGDGPTEVAEEPVGPILVLGDGGTQDSVLTVLDAAGIAAEFGGNYWEWDGSGLDEASAVILLTGVTYTQDMPDSIQDTLVSFVASGGGLMTTEWMLYDADAGYYDRVAAMAPALYDEDYDEDVETYTVVASGHPIAAGLPASFLTPDTDWSYSYTVADPAAFKQATVVLTGSVSGAAVVAGRFGEGRTVHWNMAGQYDGEDIWSAEVRALLANIARYISGAAS